MHQVRARANSDQTRQGAVVGKARVVAANDKGGNGATRHRHERVGGDQATDLVQCLGAHDVKAEPAYRQNPGAQGQERNR